MLNATELAIVLHLIKKHGGGGSAIIDGIHYRGAVNYYANLPADAEEGDAYTVKYAGSTGTVADGTEYVWGKLDGTLTWIDFSKDSYTKAEIDKMISPIAASESWVFKMADGSTVTKKVRVSNV